MKAPHHRKSELPLHKSKRLGRNLVKYRRTILWTRGHKLAQLSLLQTLTVSQILTIWFLYFFKRFLSILYSFEFKFLWYFIVLRQRRRYSECLLDIKITRSIDTIKMWSSLKGVHVSTDRNLEWFKDVSLAHYRRTILLAQRATCTQTQSHVASERRIFP